jgi:hypothetical protein
VKRWHLLALVWTLPSLVFIGATASVYSAFRISPPQLLDEGDRHRVMVPLRAALENRDAPACDVHRSGERLAVSVWLDGRVVARVDGTGDDVAMATDAAAKSLRTSVQGRVPPEAVAKARIQVDIVTGTGPLGGGHWLFDLMAVPGIGSMLAINPGVEGIGVTMGDRTALILPHELVQAKLLSTKRPSDAFPDFAMGVDIQRIAALATSRLGAHEAVPASALYRFRTNTFVETPDHGSTLPLYRGVPPAPPLSAATLREAALNGARYLIAHEAPNGRYVYEHDLATGIKTDPIHSSSYSMPRHGGTTYFLAELYRITKEEWLREPIERAFAHLAELLAQGHCATTLPDGTQIDCVLDKMENTAQLGSTALVVVALAEYQRATGDARYLPVATKLAAFLMYMQRPDGSFRHLYDPRLKRPDDKAELLYYSGEATLALARMYVVTNDAKYVQAAERGLDWLVDWYDFFMGGFFYGEEHWTCIAAEAMWPAVKKPKYKEFCDGYGAFLRAQQPEVGEHPDEDDLAGAYNFTPFVPPYNTPAGSRTEAMISAYLLGVHHGDTDERIRGQIRAALQYALGQQIRPDNDFDVVGDGDGGMPGSPIERNVRIDYVQHVCSAMIRASEWIDQPPPP